MRRLIILRPEPGASATQARAEAMGLQALKIPLFETEPLPWTAPDPADFDALLVTSANAVRYGGEQFEQLRNLPALAVGDATAAALRAAGFQVSAVGCGGVDDLQRSLKPGLRLLHLAGADHRRAEGAEQKITPVIVYQSVPLEEPADLSVFADAVALVHSPRAARQLGEIVHNRSSVRIAAISPAAAAACGSGWAAVVAAERPSDEALLPLAERLCKDSLPQ